MNLEHPLALVLLVVPPILLWLRTRAERPRAAEASSLLVWRKVSPAETVPEKPRPPVAAWIEAAGAALLALGMAGPLGPAGEPSPVTLLSDRSPSMGGGTAEVMLATDALPDAKVQEWPSVDPERDLPAQLSSGRPVVVVTDHRMSPFADDPPRLRVVGIGERGFNAGITAASGEVLPDGRWRILLVVEAHGAKGPTAGALRMGALEESITIGPGSPLELVRDVPAGVAWARVLFPGDSMHADDSVTLRGAGGRAVELVSPAREDLRPLVRALVAAGARRVEGAGNPDRIRLRGGEEFGLDLRLPGPGATPEGGPIEGRSVTVSDHPLTWEVRIDPGVTLGTKMEEKLTGSVGMPPTTRTLTVLLGTGLLVEGDRCVASYMPETKDLVGDASVSFLFIPGGTWVERDPSFVVFARNLVEFAAGGPARIEATGVLDAKETREAAEGETFGDLRAAIEEASRPDPASRTSYAFLLLMTGGIALASAWLAMR